MTYLIDTDWIIDAMAPVPASLASLNSLSASGLAVSIITFAELCEGAYRSPDPTAGMRAIRLFLAGYVMIDLSEAIAERFARITPRRSTTR